MTWTTDEAARVAFYSHDTFGLGHLRRCLKIAAALARRLPRVSGIVLTGSPWSHLFPLPRGFSCVTLPPVVKTGPRGYRARDGRLGIEDVLADRSRRLRREISRFAPDLLVVDNVPCGLAGELLPALHMHRRHGGRLALSLRDVLDGDAAIRREWRAAGADAVVAELYDEIWIFGESGAPAYLALPASARAKTVFCGFLADGDAAAGPEAATVAPGPAGPSPRVLVTGGGGADAGTLIGTYLLALQRLRPGGTHRIVLGPDFPPALLPPPGELAALGATCIPFEADMPAAIARAEVVVSMAGYNTVCESLAAGRRMVLVPRHWPRREQWLRASALATTGRAEIVPADALTPEGLWCAVQLALARPAPRACALEGAARVAERAAELLGLSRMPGRAPGLASA